jgi:hypothetical protein
VNNNQLFFLINCVGFIASVCLIGTGHWIAGALLLVWASIPFPTR